ncbi:DPH-type domain-containing protein [Haematococcus lacustris]|uniref:DPH-type domain-containing protein n=1 Tax=Haematococcus lacustris TaxID=44745 RepID=A0A699YU15_HAELA|nr:DPH-type domain-containing protein [Haematococcus lacustris]
MCRARMLLAVPKALCNSTPSHTSGNTRGWSDATAHLLHRGVTLRDFVTSDQDELKRGEEVARCPSCSLYITVVYNPEDFQEEPQPPPSLPPASVTVDVVA